MVSHVKKARLNAVNDNYKNIILHHINIKPSFFEIIKLKSKTTID